MYYIYKLCLYPKVQTAEPIQTAHDLRKCLLTVRIKNFASKTFRVSKKISKVGAGRSLSFTFF